MVTGTRRRVFFFPIACTRIIPFADIAYYDIIVSSARHNARLKAVQESAA
ncbi:hypothetical protein AGMMS49991_10520 [Spirochaetia bacterium]|nr:hypothetical protein AGMMS49991_10520 [Spirochaetia bacterium]